MFENDAFSKGIDAPPDALDLAIVRELRRPLAAEPDRFARARAAIMGRVHASAAPARRRRMARRGGWARPGWASIGTTAIAAGVGALMALGALDPAIRESAHEDPSSPVMMLGDTVVSTIRDSMRLVRFMFVAPAASRVALAGDFNRWSTHATPLAAESTGVWSVAVALTPGRHRYSYVVDDTQWIGGRTLKTSADTAN